MPYAPTPRVLVEQDGPVAVVTLNNPDERNALLDDMHAALRELWWDLAYDRNVRAAVITGAGTAFSAGGNVPNFIRDYEDLEHRRQSLWGARRLMEAMVEFPKPLVAAVNGPAVGLGCNIALSADIVLIAESTFIADSHVSIGLVCGDGGAALWPLYIGFLRAKEYLLTGERIPAAKAVELGLANRAVPDDQLMTEAMTLANKLADQPVQALQETKRALNLHLQAAITRVVPFALAAESESFGTDDIRKTIEQFKSK